MKSKEALHRIKMGLFDNVIEDIRVIEEDLDILEILKKNIETPNDKAPIFITILRTDKDNNLKLEWFAIKEWLKRRENDK